MTIEERKNKLKAFITCLKCEVRGRYCSDECGTQYEAGNMGEIIENLEAISKALEQDSKPIDYYDCSSAMLKLWMENIVTDSEYYRIIDKLNARHKEGDTK